MTNIWRNAFALRVTLAVSVGRMQRAETIGWCSPAVSRREGRSATTRAHCKDRQRRLSRPTCDSPRCEGGSWGLVPSAHLTSEVVRVRVTKPDVSDPCNEPYWLLLPP